MCILTLSGSLWLTLALSGSLSGSLWLSLARCPALPGSLWLSLALPGSLWLSLALFGSLRISLRYSTLSWSVIHYLDCVTLHLIRQKGYQRMNNRMFPF